MVAPLFLRKKCTFFYSITSLISEDAYEPSFGRTPAIDPWHHRVG
jgi:hypothetical protein